MRIADIPLGRVIEINGQKFVKIGFDVVKGSQFAAMAKVNILPSNTRPTANCPRERIIGTMQTWNNCANLAKPTGTNYTEIGCLVDERDGKPYEIRKFSDGKCWMVDNLAYGGASDACATRTAFAGSGSSSVTNRFGAGTYGDCRNNSSYPTYGYLYSYQAVVQSAYTYYCSSYQVSQPTQGICPASWHVSAIGEYQTLHTAAGSPATGFWQGENWKGALFGRCDGSGNFVQQEEYGMYWTSTQYDECVAFYTFVSSSNINFAFNGHKFMGLAVRCVKN